MKTDDQTLENAATSLICVPWNGTKCMVKVREITAIQLLALGNFTMINVDKLPVNADERNWAEFSEMHHNIVKAALVSPSYDEIFELIGKGGMVKEAEQAFKEISLEIAKMDAGPERQLFEKRAASLKALFKLILPDDFIIAVSDYATGKSRSDIDKVTADILYEAALLRQVQGGRVSDYCDGKFTPFMKADIDRAGLYVFAKRQEQMKGKR